MTSVESSISALVDCYQWNCLMQTNCHLQQGTPTLLEPLGIRLQMSIEGEEGEERSSTRIVNIIPKCINYFRLFGIIYDFHKGIFDIIGVVAAVW